jgi:hypothetical protein
LSYQEEYPLFKHLGQRYGGVKFRYGPVSAYKVHMYQLWTHWVKATDLSDIYVPTTYKSARETFAVKYELLLRRLAHADVVPRLGGFRIEITLTAPTFSIARDLVVSHLSLRFWVDRGVIVNRIGARQILRTCAEGLKIARERGILTGRSSNDLKDWEKTACVHP